MIFIWTGTRIASCLYCDQMYFFLAGHSRIHTLYCAAKYIYVYFRYLLCEQDI